MIQGVYYKPSDYHVAYLKNNPPKMVPIAPPPGRMSITMDPPITKNKHNCKNNTYYGLQIASIAKRNARERNRVKQVNDGFNALRKRLPASVIAALSGGTRRGSGKKISKVDTLRMVVQYIKYLQNIIEEGDAALRIPTSVDTVESLNSYEVEEGIFGDESPYSESVLSPFSSDSSSGVSSVSSDRLSLNVYPPHDDHVTPLDENDLLDAISWWQQK